MTCSKINIEALGRLLAAAASWPPGKPGWPAKVDVPADAIQRAAAILDIARDDSTCLEFLSNPDEVGLGGAGLIRLLPWDTQFFGWPCARIELFTALGENHARHAAAEKIITNLLTWAIDRKVEFVAVKLPGPDPLLVQALEEAGFYVTDNVVALHRQIWQALPAPILPTGCSWSDLADDPAATARTFGSLFNDGRFHNDRRISRETADRLWTSALENQLAGAAREMLILERESRPIGLATIQPETNPGQERETGSLFILSVKPEERGRGLGKALLTEILRWTQERYARIQVETSTFNAPALNLYQSLGFRPTGFKLSLHWWREKKMP